MHNFLNELKAKVMNPVLIISATKPKMPGYKK
jgi:hypothetical protein